MLKLPRLELSLHVKLLVFFDLVFVLLTLATENDKPIQ